MPSDESILLADLDLTPVLNPQGSTARPASPAATSAVVEASTPEKDDRSTFYSSLSADQAANLRAATSRITAATDVIGKNMLVIGHELNTVSSEMPGHFEEWLRLEFSMSRASAYHYMNVAAEFADVPTILDLLPATTVYKLAAKTTPAEVRDEVVREITAGEPVSAKDVKGRIADAKAKAADAKRLEAERKKQKHPPAANDDVKVADEEVAGGQGKVTASPLLPGSDGSALGPDASVDAVEKRKKESLGQTEQTAHEALASLRRHLPGEVLEMLVACARDDAAWHALGSMLGATSELSAAA